LSQTEIGPENNISYSGKPLDDEMGLIYFGTRQYDPQIGRFTSIDPATAQNYYTAQSGDFELYVITPFLRSYH